MRILIDLNLINYLIVASGGDETIVTSVPRNVWRGITSCPAQDDGISTFDVDVGTRPHENDGRQRVRLMSQRAGGFVISNFTFIISNQIMLISFPIDLAQFDIITFNVNVGAGHDLLVDRLGYASINGLGVAINAIDEQTGFGRSQTSGRQQRLNLGDFV